MANSGSFVKGQKKPNQGKRGPNRTTVQVREAITRLLDENVGSMGRWLEEIARKDPAKAFQCITSLLEYSVPKLTRQELTGPENGPIKTEDATYQKLLAILSNMEMQKRNG